MDDYKPLTPEQIHELWHNGPEDGTARRIEQAAIENYLAQYPAPQDAQVGKDAERYRALAWAQAAGPTPKQEAALQALADEAQALGLYDAQAQASGKAAPSDEDIIHIAVRTVPAFTNSDALTFARALLERYGNHE